MVVDRTLRSLLSLAVVITFSAGAVVSKDRPDERLKTVTSVFVSGNNQAAEGARSTLKGTKTCLSLAVNPEKADAVLSIAAEGQSQGGMIGGFGGRAWIASGTLTLKPNDLVWSRSERFSDSPFRSGAKTAGDLLVRHLAADSACHERQKLGH